MESYSSNIPTFLARLLVVRYSVASDTFFDHLLFKSKDVVVKYGYIYLLCLMLA